MEKTAQAHPRTSSKIALNRKVEQAIELYRAGQVTAWRAAQLMGVSLWLCKMLEEKAS